MTNAFGIVIEILVAFLLVLTIAYCMSLNRRLKLLRSDEHSLRATISELVTATMSGSAGRARATSVPRMSTESTGPEKYPLITPMAAPRVVASAVAENPTITETWAPSKISSKTLRPS